MANKILIVDDESEVRALIEAFAKDVCNQIDQAENGAIGFEKALKGHYSCIVSDISMPQMTGLDMLKKLREANVTTPFIFITGHDGEEIRFEAANAGVIKCLNKIEISSIGSKIAEAVRIYQESLLIDSDKDMDEFIRLSQNIKVK
jgi:DNA-binding response OmpR family regulator